MPRSSITIPEVHNETGPTRPRSSAGRKPRTRLQTVDRALTMLEYVAADGPAPTIREVAEALSLNLATTYHLYNTLTLRGYLARDSAGRLHIGPKAAILYQAQVRSFAPARDLQPIMEDLATNTSETVYLALLSDVGIVIHSIIEASYELRVSGLYVGFYGQEHRRASGKAILSHLPRDKWHDIVLPQIVEEHTDAEVAQLMAELDHQLAAVRDRAYAIDDQEYCPGVCCVSAPFFGSDGSAVGSITLSAPVSRFHSASGALIEAVVMAATSASEAHGFFAATRA